MSFASEVWDVMYGGGGCGVLVEGYPEAPADRADRVAGRSYWYVGQVGVKLGVANKKHLNLLCLVCAAEHRMKAFAKCGGLCPKHFSLLE